MFAEGNLSKLFGQLAQPIEYALVLNNQRYALNEHIGKLIKLTFTGQINCTACQRRIKKTYNQGFCFPCSQKLAVCDMCILKPSLCHYEQGTCREPEWGQANCFIPHMVYLANSSGVKVGITRETQIPTRWIDQGAIAALPILKVQSRYQSGLIESTFAREVSDKTNWRKMLTNQVPNIDLVSVKEELLSKVRDEINEISSQFKPGDIAFLETNDITELTFPVHQYPSKVSSFNFDKTPEIQATLEGIKGQYLIFDTGVINIRKFTGYFVQFEVDE